MVDVDVATTVSRAANAPAARSIWVLDGTVLLNFMIWMAMMAL
jgi:hypothetical protein